MLDDVYCPECREKISQDADYCPHCGAPASYQARRGAESDDNQQEAAPDHDEHPILFSSISADQVPHEHAWARQWWIPSYVRVWVAWPNLRTGQKVWESLGVVWVILGVGFIVWATTTYPEGVMNRSAWDSAQYFVEDRLPAPATAQWPSYRPDDVSELGGNRWRVTSYVDAQNVMGATIRWKYQCEMTHSSDDTKWYLEKLIVNGRDWLNR